MHLLALTKGKYAKIDPCDVARVSQFKWWAEPKNGGKWVYAVAKIDGRTQFLHRYLLNAPKGVLVDHKNGDGLDNRRENIRLCNHADNSRNRRIKPSRAGFRGVILRDRPFRNVRYEASIKVERKKIYLGVFDTPEAAARAYDQAAIKHFGDFACLNFPGGRS